MARSVRVHLVAVWQVTWLVWSFSSCVTLGHESRFYDELLWTKRNWNEYVLAFPYNDVLAKVGPSSRAFLGSIVDVDVLKDISESAAIDFEVRAEPLPADLTTFSPSNRRDMSRLLACEAQTGLAEILWPVVANWTMTHVRRLEDSQLLGLVDEACRIDVPVLVLKDELLALITVEREKSVDQGSNVGQGDGVEQPGKVVGTEKMEKTKKMEKMEKTGRERVLERSMYVAAMSRRSQHASSGEVSVVVSACKEAANDTWRQMMLQAQGMYLEVVRGVVRDKNGRLEAAGDVAGGGGPDFDTTIEIDRSCCDYHPQCQMWASKGECKANPKYMVGTEETGQCRLACGVCQVRGILSSCA